MDLYSGRVTLVRELLTQVCTCIARVTAVDARRQSLRRQRMSWPKGTSFLSLLTIFLDAPNCRPLFFRESYSKPNRSRFKVRWRK